MATSPVVSPWVQIKAQLDGDPGNWATKRYLRADGGEGMEYHFGLINTDD